LFDHPANEMLWTEKDRFISIKIGFGRMHKFMTPLTFVALSKSAVTNEAT